MVLAIYYHNGSDLETTPVELLPPGDEWQKGETVTRNSRGQVIAWLFRDGDHHGEPVPTGTQMALNFEGVSYMTLLENEDQVGEWNLFLRQHEEAVNAAKQEEELYGVSYSDSGGDNDCDDNYFDDGGD